MEQLLQDDNFKILVDALSPDSSLPSNQIISIMTRFRKNLCFEWISKIVKANNKDIDPCLAKIIRTILQYTIHSDATVRVTAYSSLGGLLVTIAPFAVNLFPKSFQTAIDGVEVTPKLSIAVINMFMFLTRFLSPVSLEKYIVDVPVSFHFSVDVSEFIQYIPKSIPLMKGIPLVLLQNILRSLICSCGRKPNAAFTSTIVSLVRLNTKPQLAVLLNYIKANDLAAAAVWLGPHLLDDPEIFNALSEDDKNMFFNYAIKEFARTPLNLGQFELACKLCALFLRYSKDQSVYDNYMSIIQNELNQRDYPPIYKVRMLFLPTNLDQLQDNSSDMDSLRSARLTALATHFEDNINTCDADQIAKMFASYQNSDNDLYCTFVDSFSRCIAGMLNKCKEKVHIEILEFILKKKNKNWVHDEAVAHLIDNIPTILCQHYLPTYTDLALDKLLEFSLSSNDRLVNTTLDSLKKFASFTNLENILMRIIKTDFLDEDAVERRFNLLSELALVFKSDLFLMFVNIAYECLLLYDNTSTLSFIYAFLSRIQFDQAHEVVPQKIITFSLSFIIKHYQLYTRKDLEKEGVYDIAVPEEYFLETLDTDIVTNPTINHQDALKHVKNCYAFLLAHKPQSTTDMMLLFDLSIRLVPIFDTFALEGAAALVGDNRDYDEMMWYLAGVTFKSTSNDGVAAACCRYFVKSNRPLPPDIAKNVSDYLVQESTLDPELLFLCFVLTDVMDHALAMEKLPVLIQRLPPKEATLLVFKLSQVVGKINTEQFPEEYSIALLEYAVNFGGVYQERVQKYIDTVPFSDWPLEDNIMNKELVQFLGPNAHIKVPLFEYYRNKKPNQNLIDSANELIQQESTDNQNSTINSGAVPETEIQLQDGNENTSTNITKTNETPTENNDTAETANENHSTGEATNEDNEAPNSENANENTNKITTNDSTVVVNGSEPVNNLDHHHWLFVINNLNLFDRQGVLNYILSHRDLFNKIDLSSIIPPRKIEKHFDKQYSPVDKSNLIKLCSLASFLNRNYYLEDIALSRSYFLNSNTRTSWQLIKKYLDLYLSQNNEAGLLALLKYAYKTKIAFNLTEKEEDQLLFDNDLFFTDDAFPYTMRQLQRIYGSFMKIHQNIIDRIEKKIGQKIEPSLIFTDDPLIISVVVVDPKPFLNHILSRVVYKAHEFLPFMKFLAKINFDAQKIVSLATRYIVQYAEFKSIRKRVVFLRFLNCALQSLERQQKRDELTVIIDGINEIFVTIVSSLSSSMYKEISILLHFLIQNSMRTDFYTESFLQNITIKNVTYPMFIRSMAYLLIKKKEQQSSLPYRNIRKFNMYLLPSEQNQVFQTIQMLSSDSGFVEFFALIKPYLTSIQPNLFSIAKNFLTGAPFDLLLLNILMHPESIDLIPDEFYTDFIRNFLSNPKRPIFNTSLPLCNCLVKRIPMVFNNLLKLKFYTPLLISTISKVYVEVRNQKSSRRQKEVFDMQIFEAYYDIVMEYVTVPSVKLLYSIGKGFADLASFFFNRLVISTKTNFYSVFLVLRAIYNVSDSKVKHLISTVVTATHDIYAPKSRAATMDAIVGERQNEKCLDFLIAASETDDVDAIIKEYSDLIEKRVQY